MQHAKRGTADFARAATQRDSYHSRNAQIEVFENVRNINKKKTFSRSRLYSNTNIRRFIVPPCLSGWDSSFEEYQPVNFTKEEFLDQKLAPYADTNNSENITFNSWDAELQIDRRSYRKRNTQFYSIVEGVPRNPIGRTGVTGRGHLHLWGPTHAVDPIIVRWKNQELKQMEFLAIKRQDGR